MSCSVGRRRSSNLMLLWLWCRPAATAPIRPLSWEPPYAASAALKRPQKKKNFKFIVITFEIVYHTDKNLGCVHLKEKRCLSSLPLFLRLILRKTNLQQLEWSLIITLENI